MIILNHFIIFEMNSYFFKYFSLSFYQLLVKFYLFDLLMF